MLITGDDTERELHRAAQSRDRFAEQIYADYLEELGDTVNARLVRTLGILTWDAAGKESQQFNARLILPWTKKAYSTWREPIDTTKYVATVRWLGGKWYACWHPPMHGKRSKYHMEMYGNMGLIGHSTHDNRKDAVKAAILGACTVNRINEKGRVVAINWDTTHTDM